MRSLPEKAVVLFEDETDLLLFPPLGATWSKRGQSQEVLLSGCNARRVIYGAMSAKSGHLMLMPQKRHRAVDFQEFLDVIRWHYPAGKVVMLLDEDSSHTAEDSQECACANEIELWWLPVRSPELNPMERLWREGKQHICMNYQHPSIEEQATQFTDYLLRLSNVETLVTSGMTSKKFWLLK